MSVETKYIVKRKGIEVMSSVSQKEANAYDKMLDISDELTIFLEDKFTEILGQDIDEKKLEEICVFMASNKEDVSKMLRGQKLDKEEIKEVKKPKKTKKATSEK